MVRRWHACGSDPGVNEPPPCGIVIELVGTSYERIFPTEPGTYECNESWNAGFTNRWTDDAELDENRVSQNSQLSSALK